MSCSFLLCISEAEGRVIDDNNPPKATNLEVIKSNPSLCLLKTNDKVDF